MSREAMKLALEALDIVKIHFTQNRHVNEAITTLREALAEQPARPYRQLQDNGSKYFGESWDKAEQPAQHLSGLAVYLDPSDGLKPKRYAPQPAQRTWVGLTNQERENVIYNSMTPACVLLATEAKLKEKNT